MQSINRLLVKKFFSTIRQPFNFNLNLMKKLPLYLAFE